MDITDAPQTMDRPALCMADGMVWREGRFSAIERRLPEEIAEAIMAGKRPAAVVIASPADYEDLAVGFALTEGIAANPSAITDCRVTQEQGGVRVTLSLVQAGAVRERVLPGRSSCGLCGVSDLRQAIRAIPRVAEGGYLAPEILHAAIAALESHQPLNDRTRAVHAAAHVGQDGRIT